jgi:hypothetical protein
MTDDTRNDKSSQQEPSMEDILASIRRILAEDATAETEADAEDGRASRAEPIPAAQPQPPPSTPKAAPAVEATAAVSVEEKPRPAASARAERQRPAEREVVKQEPTQARDDDVFELTPAMKAPSEHKVVSNVPADSATDVLAQLARAILERRDVGVTSRDVTLEGMVRAMLKPLLKEWLDRNLPYLIERLVKREIDLMVNRAEKLE